MSNHTPGPWEQARTDQCDQSIDIFESKTARTLARTINTLPIEEAEANARLIASAPDLLASLQDALSSLERLEDKDGAYRVTCIAQAKAAIAKAEGKSA